MINVETPENLIFTRSWNKIICDISVYLVLLVKCQNPQMLHWYARISLVTQVTVICWIISSASAFE